MQWNTGTHCCGVLSATLFQAVGLHLLFRDVNIVGDIITPLAFVAYILSIPLLL